MKGKNFLFSFMLVFVLLSFCRLALADVTIGVTNLDEKTMRVTYSLVCSKAEETEKTFPSRGYSFASGPIKVINVIEKNSEQDLKYEIVKAPKAEDLQAVKIYYPKPIPKGGSYKIEITVEAKTKNISEDKDGRYVFNYTTKRPKVFFVLPEGHAIVYSNYPASVDERKGRTVVRVERSGKKDLVFKTRAFKMSEASR